MITEALTRFNLLGNTDSWKTTRFLCTGTDAPFVGCLAKFSGHNVAPALPADDAILGGIIIDLPSEPEDQSVIVALSGSFDWHQIKYADGSAPSPAAIKRLRDHQIFMDPAVKYGADEVDEAPPVEPGLIDSFPVEQQNDIGSYGIRDSINQPYQAFTAPRDCQLKKATLSVRRVGNPIGEVLVAVRDGSGAFPNMVPGGRLTGSRKLDVTTITTGADGALYDFDFLSPVQLRQGQNYCVVLEKFNDGTTTFDSPDYLMVGFHFTYGPPPGEHYGNGGYNQDGAFSSDAAGDMIFYLREP